ncbi:putative Nitroreductase-like protein [Seiridium cardinale]|uniref:Nitroreductase-like protein n=1 Tax=Seiridium cardinale TaxID=138064 RepID=A0ABR2XJ15_9PEZI
MSSSTTASADALLKLIQGRRSYYNLNKNLDISKERITEIVKQATKDVPSSFNAQPVRVVVLFGAEHDKLWDITAEVLKAMVPAENWESTGQRLSGFKGAAGTILFFEDSETIKKQQSQFALYADKFPGWAEQSDGMLQYTLWVALEAEGLGANLQHYNPVIDQKVAAQWNIPEDWKLNAQLVFGGIEGSKELPPRDFIALDERVKVFGA